MEDTPIRLGPLSLLLTVVCICLSVLAILTFATARADRALAERYADTVSTRYALEREGQSFLLTAEPGAEAVFERDGMRLRVALDDNGDVICWTVDKEWKQDETIGGLWTGE